MKNYLLGLLIVVSISFANDIDLDALTLQAKKSNKHIFVYLHITGCDFCMRMEEFAFDDEDVISAIKKDFIFVDINVKDNGVVKYDNAKMSKLQFAKESGYPMYPTCLFFDKNGELVYDVVGYKDEYKLLKILTTVSSKSYDDLE